MGNCVGSGILKPEDQEKKKIIGCLLSDQMDNCVGSGILKPEDQANQIITGSEMKDQDSTDSCPSNVSANISRLHAVEHAAANSCGSISRLSVHPPSLNSHKREIRGSEEEKKKRFGPSRGVLGRGRADCCRVKVVISTKRLSEMLSDGHTSKEALLSFLVGKLQTEGRSRTRGLKFGKPASRNRLAAAWTPSLEVIPEESSRIRYSRVPSAPSAASYVASI